MEAFLRLLSTGAVRTGPLTEVSLPVDRAGEGYAEIGGDEPPLAVLLTYDGKAPPQPEVVRVTATDASTKDTLTVALIGAGSFVQGVRVPDLRSAAGVTVKLVVSRTGRSAGDVARQLGAADTSTDWKVATGDPDVDLLLVGTRHDSHAEIAAAGLRAGKAVFVEKPLGLTRAEIDDVWAASRENPRLAIGFNRPFAPLAKALEEQVREAGGPTHLIYRVSSPLPPDHWLNDPVQGGGRLLGEGCHMFDFANWLCGTPIRVQAAGLPAPGKLATPESTSVSVEYADGSVAAIHYSGVGAASLPKERIELLRGGLAWVLDDFTTLICYGPDGDHIERSAKPDKGHAELLERLLAAARGEAPFEPGIEAAYAAQSVALAGLEALATGSSIEVLPAPER
jgi:predicted dehydrogenase